MRQRSCLVVDDHPPVVEGVATFLEARGVGVLRGLPGADPIESIRELRPDVALVGTQGAAGADVARAAARFAPGTAVVVYAGSADPHDVVAALDAGARGFVLKKASLDELLHAVEAAAGGGTYVDPALGAELMRRPLVTKAGDLTAREREVLRLLAGGCSTDEVSRRLGLSAETVRTHQRKAMKKLCAVTRTEAVATALRRSLIR